VPPPRVREDYYPRNYDDLYPAVSTSKRSKASSATTERNELRRARRKEQRAKYFNLVGSRQHGKSRDERERVIAEFERKIASPEPMEWLFDTASGSPFDAAVFGYAAKSLWRERYLDALAGDGAFSDVFLTHQSSKVAAQRFGAGDAVLKCSNPFPGVVNGGAVGDGYRMGKVEATTLASVPTHPAIVRIYAAFLEKSRNESYLLLSAAGKDAHTMRENGELTPRDVRSALRRVLHGVRHCHSHGVVHRDIKAGNVLLSPTPANARVKTKYRATLIDFGVAKQAILADQSHCSMYGTPGYQAPEMLLGDMSGKVDMDEYAKVDMFAFGVTAFFLCTGKELFGGSADENAPNKPEAEAKVKRVAMAFWRRDGDRGGDDDASEEDASDALILSSMLSYADMKMPANHARRFVEMYGDAGIPVATATTTLERRVGEALSRSQPKPFAELIAACLAYDAKRRPSATEALLWKDAWRDVADDDDVEDHSWRSGASEVCFLPPATTM
jgi:serine/threonine protein kinase